MSINVKNRLKYVRSCLKLSQKNFSAYLKIPLRTYQNWEEGNTVPDLETFVNIADKLCVSMDWLAGREKNIVLYNCKIEDVIINNYKKHKE